MTELEKALNYARDVGLTDRHIAYAVQAAADQARFENAPGLVRLVHPGLPDQPIDVPADAVQGHVDSGWQIEPTVADMATGTDLTVEEEPAPVKASRTKKTEE